jgi:hypothetical protein
MKEFWSGHSENIQLEMDRNCQVLSLNMESQKASI